MNLREIDKEIAERMFGQVVERSTEQFDFLYYPDFLDGYGNVIQVPHYSSNMGDAWLVVEKLDFVFTIKKHTARMENLYGPKGKMYSCDVTIDFGKHYSTSADTAPLAICLAALKAITPDNA